MQKSNYRLAVLPSTQNVARALAWLVAVLILLNALYFVLRASSPVIRDDAWYFLDVFLRKAINGSLSLGDFFVKRAGDDHAQPLLKLLMLFEWRYFDLDFAVGAVVGVFAAAACALVFYRVIVAERSNDRGDVYRYLAWIAICAVLLSLNADAAVWTWPLVALGNVTNLIILLFFLGVWYAHQKQRYVVLTLATLLLGISSDDSALIAIIAAVVALLLAQLCDPAQRRRSTWRLLAVVGVCTMLVRIGYTHAPVVGGIVSTPLTSHLGLLFEHFRDKGWWMWAVLPLTLPVFYQNPFQFLHAETWLVVQMAMGAALFLAHLWFWWVAFRGKYSRAVFVAVCLMLLSYGWLAGIILARVPVYGNDYLNQPRYVLLYAGHLIALLLMWAGSSGALPRPSLRRRAIGTWVPAVGCLALLAAQIPLSIQAWRMPPYLWAYYVQMAHQTDDLARDPGHSHTCVPELPVCSWSPETRRELTQLLSQNQLNVFSPQMQRRHAYLPRLAPGPAMPLPLSADKQGPSSAKPD